MSVLEGVFGWVDEYLGAKVQSLKALHVVKLFTFLMKIKKYSSLCLPDYLSQVVRV